MKYKLLLITITHLLLTGILHSGRSIYRPRDPLMPEMITNWEGQNKFYNFKDSHLEESAIFLKFDYNHFMNHLLPMGPIRYRNEAKFVPGKKLDDLAHNLVNELYEHKKKFTDFVVLKDNDFNYKSISGDLVLKFKDYPFVLKLFIETPETFVKPFSKGWQPACFFLMSGGVSRYLSGFTRIKNLEISQQKINAHPYWSTKRIQFPRKAYGFYKHQTWFIVRGKNIGLSEPDLTRLTTDLASIDCRAIETANSISSSEMGSLILNKNNRPFRFTRSISYATDPIMPNASSSIALAKNTSTNPISSISSNKLISNANIQSQEIMLPSIYWIFCDEIEKDKTKDISKEEYPNFALDLSNDIGNGLDPNDGNILIEAGTGERVIIDTEHFPSMVGLKEPIKFTSYTHWYYRLSTMALDAQFCRHKHCRRNIQTRRPRRIKL